MARAGLLHFSNMDNSGQVPDEKPLCTTIKKEAFLWRMKTL